MGKWGYNPSKWSYFTLLITGFWAQLVMACNVMPLNPRGGWRGTPSVGMVARYPTEMVLLMEEIRLTSWYGKYPIIYKVLYIPGGDRRISSINSSHLPTNFEQSGSCGGSFLLLPMPNADFSTFQPQTTQKCLHVPWCVKKFWSIPLLKWISSLFQFWYTFYGGFWWGNSRDELNDQ